MSQAIDILEFLDDIKPRAECDDCLSSELDIRPRQTVNQICRALAAAKRIERVRAKCFRCGNVKLTSAFVGSATFAAAHPAPVASGSPSSSRETSAVPPLDIEKTRTEIVRICRTLWQNTKSEEPPKSLGAIIHLLRSEGVVQNHPANMMQTLCNLRNAHVYEGLDLGPKELAIAMNARAIVMDW